MKLLALDTSSDACSVALQLGEDVIEDHVVGAREHTRILVPMIRSLLEEAQVSLAELDAIVLGNGPGSFIGMRIGASVAQGLAHGAGINIVPVSSLLAVAEEVVASEDADRVVVAQDARMSEVYLGVFERNGNGRVQAANSERIVRSDHRVHETGAFVAAGGGWERYPDLTDANVAAIRSMSAVLRPRSLFLLPAGSAGFDAGKAVSPDRLEPAYLRAKVAEKPA
jgi:tRNA threonylcarbamoyladenosine biosynthesis protein TsaB